MMSGKASLLPSGYKQLDYIENSGTQYIQTGVIMTPTCGIDVKVTSYSQDVYKNYYVCSGYAWSQSNFTIGIAWENSGRNGKVFVSAGSNNGQTVCQNQASNVTPQTHIIQANPNSGVIVDDVNIYDSAFSTCTSPRLPYFVVFGRGGESTTTIKKSTYPVRIHYCRLYEADHDLINLIPCINPQNEVGMFDLVTQQFFGNNGDGEFVAGNPI